MSPPSRPSWSGAAAATLLAGLAAWAWSAGYGGAPGWQPAILGGYTARGFALAVASSYAALAVLAWTLFRPGRGALGRIVLVHGGVLVALVLMEAAAAFGLVDFSPERRSARWRESAEHRDPRLRVMTAPHVDYAAPVRPDLVDILGLEADPVPVHYTTDRYGLRNARDKPDPRVLCLGDSVLAAALVPLEEIVTERLEERLGVPVLNVSEPGLSLPEERIRLEATGLEVRERLVLQFLFEGNYLRDAAARRAWRAASDGSGWPASGPTQALRRLLTWPRPDAPRLREGLFRGRDGAEQPVHFGYDAQGMAAARGELPQLEAWLTETRREVREAGGLYALVFVPAKITVLHPFVRWPEGSSLADPARWESGLAEGVAAAARRVRVPFLDLTPALREAAAAGELPFFPADSHPNARGHEAMARALEPWVRRLLLQLLSAGATAGLSRWEPELTPPPSPPVDPGSASSERSRR
ncbi:MAG: hypothetical protein QNK04_30230 [Myxococcota bacterium]|nr:hypothetical protein [Myxococcota bacterium]